MKRLVVIDGKSVFYRGYYAMPGLSTRDGTPTGGVFGFASLALELMKKLDPDYVAVAWDKKGTSIRRRREIYPDYKAGRKTPPEDFFAQIPILHQLLDAFGWPLYECDDYEADDIMGVLSDKASKEGIETCLITSDLDMLQLIGPLTHVYALKSGLTNIEQFDLGYFENKYGLSVHQFLDLKALKGDSSDNLPGVPGVGEKTATQLLQEYGTLDEVYAHLDDIKPTVAKKLVAGKELAYLSKQVGEIWLDAPVPLDLEATNARDLDTVKLASLLKELEFTSLLKRLPTHMQQTEEAKAVVARPDALRAVAWPATLQINGDAPVLVHLADERLYVATSRTEFMTSELTSIDSSTWRALEYANVVAFDGKGLYHAADRQGVSVNFDQLHDLAVAAFLLDPLVRDRTLTGLTDWEQGDDYGQLLAELWRVYDDQQARFEVEPKLSAVAHELDFPSVRLLFLMERRGIKIDQSVLTAMSRELGDEHARLEQEMYTMAGYEFNIGSPAQLSDVLFTKLQLPTTGIKKGKTSYSTSQKELDKLRGQHPIIELIERTRELAKLKNTYVDTLPLLADEQGRIHTTFNQDGTATGRMSSTNPNLQNIPVRTDLGRRIRSAFVPEPGNVFVSADYSQFELRLAAVLAGDEKLIENFNGDVDIHTKTASEVYGIPLEAVTKLQRRAAKVINFGVLYGMSPHGLSAATGMGFGEAKQFIDQYFALRAPIRAYIDATLEKATTDGYVETFYGRRRPTPDINSSNFMVREGAKRAAANMPIQGTEADLMKRAMLTVEQKLGGKGQQLLQIHDSILIECPKENAQEVADLLQSTMEQVAPELDIRLKVDVSIGENWGEL
jgi:DNA polymerase-1